MVFSWLLNLKRGLIQGTLKQKQAQARRRPVGSGFPQFTPVMIETLECRQMLSGAPVSVPSLAGSVNTAATTNPPAPVVSGIGGTTNDNSPATPITIAPNLVITGTANLSSATVSFTNWQDGDRLEFSNSYALQHTFVENNMANTATLTLTGVASIAAYQVTLQSVLYWDVAGNPNVSTRVATFTVIDIYSNSSSPATQNISFNLSSGSSPVVSGIGGTTSDTAPATPITIAPNLVITDTVNISSATISFTNWQDGDRLEFTNSYALQHTFVENNTANTATLTLTGVASIAAYQATLRSVQFWDVAGNPNVSTRVATFTVTDIYSNSSSAAMQNISFNLAGLSSPVVSGIGGTTTDTAPATPITIAPNLVITDTVDISSATVSFMNWQGGDRLQFINSYALQHTFIENNTTNTATLTLTGVASIAAYQATLRTVQYWDVAGNPNISTRVATFSVTDVYSNSSSAATQNISFNLAGQSSPVVSGIGGTTSDTAPATPITVAPNLVITDTVSISSATISFTNWQDGDRLQFTNTYALQNTFVENNTANTASLAISGLATVAQYQTTLRSVQFWSVAGNPVTSVQRVATFNVADSYAITGSGSQYIAVTTTSAPTVNNQAAATTTPTITGTYPTFAKNAPVLTVTVNGTTYTLGTSPQLTSPSAGSWVLNLGSAPLPTTTSNFTVTATMTNSFGNQLSGTGSITNEQAIIQTYLTANNLTATKTASGLDYVITTNGTGAVPTKGKTVTANYSGYLLNSNGTLGIEFDSNVDSKFGHVSPFSFNLGIGQVIAGWDQAFSLLPVGTVATLLIPSYLGYGTLGSGSSIPANSILIFNVKVVSAA